MLVRFGVHAFVLNERIGFCFLELCVQPKWRGKQLNMVLMESWYQTMELGSWMVFQRRCVVALLVVLDVL